MWRTPERDEALRRLWTEPGTTISSIAEALGTTRGTIDGASRRLGLQFKHGRSRSISLDDPAVINARSVAPITVRKADKNVLKPGGNQRKLGYRITKGKWKGFPIYSLTLEERATCPKTCEQWLSCYGNAMGRAVRYRDGKALELEIRSEITALSAKHWRGFVVRLHILGDFYSVPYVVMWSDLLLKHPQLHIFGYTHWQRGTEIGDAVAKLRDAWWTRFAVRTSDAPDGPRTTVIDHPSEAGETVVCPAQTGIGRQCSSCALCWAPAAKDKVIAFLRH